MWAALCCFLVLPGSVDCGDIVEVKLYISYTLRKVFIHVSKGAKLMKIDQELPEL